LEDQEIGININMDLD